MHLGSINYADVKNFKSHCLLVICFVLSCKTWNIFGFKMYLITLYFASSRSEILHFVIFLLFLANFENSQLRLYITEIYFEWSHLSQHHSMNVSNAFSVTVTKILHLVRISKCSHQYKCDNGSHVLVTRL